MTGTLIDIIEYLTVITVNDKTLSKINIPDEIKKNFKGLTNKNIIEISNDLLINNSLIIFGSSLTAHPDFQLLKILTNIISVLTKSNKGFLGSSSNEAGAWLSGCLPDKSKTTHGITKRGLNVLESINSKLESYIIYNLDLIDFHYYKELKESLDNAKFVIGFHSFISEEDKNFYDVILPLATIFESPGTFVNIEGEWQSFVQSCQPHHESKEGWKILTKLRLLHGAKLNNSLDYIDVLNEVDSSVRNKKLFPQYKAENIVPKKEFDGPNLIRCGGNSSYYDDNIVRRATSLNSINPNKNSASINKKTLEQNNIDLSKNKIIVKQGDSSMLVELVVDENVADDCVYIINSNKEHYELGKQYQPILIENV